MRDIPEKSLASKLIATAWQELLDQLVTTFAAIIVISAAVGTFTNIFSNGNSTSKKGRNMKNWLHLTSDPQPGHNG
ncbi:MAG: hypothetical protein B5M53_07990 [Candidatus Cloacimonas sp. 4484_209]|nr:MAG: hypothetical protein B5M53_07990 [Candidatus Cloacimonas sp. 4484_209]